MWRGKKVIGPQKNNSLSIVRALCADGRCIFVRYGGHYNLLHSVKNRSKNTLKSDAEILRQHKNLSANKKSDSNWAVITP